MSVHDAEPGDIYVDRNGKLWRVIGVLQEPSVIAQEVESINNYAEKRSGGVSGLMWDGFKRIWRKEDEPAKPRTHFDEMAQEGSGV